MSGIEGLIPIFHRRWAGAVLAELARDELALAGMARVGAMAARLGANPMAVRQSIDALVVVGAVEANAGHGHPLRPEFVLTEAGRGLAPGFLELDVRVRGLKLLELSQRKWTLPVLYSVGEGRSRFSVIGSVLPGLTDRALSLTLRELRGVGLVERTVVDGEPPRPLYEAVGAGVEISGLVGALVG